MSAKVFCRPVIHFGLLPMGASPGPGRKEQDDNDGDHDYESDDDGDAGIIGSPVCCPKSVCDGSPVPILPIT